MALTRLGRNIIVVVALSVVGGGGYYAAKQAGVFNKKQEQPVAVDIQPAEQPEAPATPSVAQQQPVEQSSPAAAPDQSTNRGMQFLLNQGKSQ